MEQGKQKANVKRCDLCDKEIEGSPVHLDDMDLCQNCADQRNYG